MVLVPAALFRDHFGLGRGQRQESFLIKCSGGGVGMAVKSSKPQRIGGKKLVSFVQVRGHRSRHGVPSLHRRPLGAKADVARECYTRPAMSTTTIRLSPELKTRVAEAAKRAGTTPHGFMLAAIAEKADAEQRRADFEAVAQSRYEGILASEKTIPWDEMRGYLQARVAGKKLRRPAARRLSR